MIRNRRTLCASLIALAGVVALPAAADAAGTRTIDTTVRLSGSGCNDTRLSLRLDVPASVVPGETITLSDISGSYRWDNGFTEFPNSIPSSANPTIESLTFTATGATPGTAQVDSGLPISLGRVGLVGGSSPGSYAYGVTLPTMGATPVVVSGASPVLLRIDEFRFRSGFQRNQLPPATSIATCKPAAGDAALAIIPSTGAVPPAPTISSASPSTGPVDGENVVTIKGANFGYLRGVEIDGRRVEAWRVVASDPSTIEVTMPPAEFARDAAVGVLTEFGRSTPVTYRYGAAPQPLPTITALSPHRVPSTAGNVEFTVTGTRLNQVSAFKIWGDYGPSFGNPVEYQRDEVEITVLEVAADGTRARVLVRREAWDWGGLSSGIPSLRAVSSEPCGQRTCLSADTAADDIVPIEATTDLPGFPTRPGEPVLSGNQLSWSPASGGAGVVGYEVFRNGFNHRTTTEPTLETFIRPESTEVFTIRAFDADGNRSRFSDPLVVVGEQPDIVAPRAPAVTTIERLSDPTVASLSFEISDEIIGVEVFQDGEKFRTTTRPSGFFRLTDLVPTETHTYKVRYLDAAGNASAFGPEATLQGAVCEGCACTVCPPTSFDFGVKGSATLKTLVKGSAPLTGTVKGAAFAPDTGAFDAELAFSQTSVKLTALGFLPIEAQLTIAPTTPLAGTLKSGVLAASVRARIKLPKVTLFGLQLGGGTSCQTKQASNIPLRSTGSFSAPAGGALAGTFSISDLTGCGSLNGIVSPLIAGGGNAIALSLSQG